MEREKYYLIFAYIHIWRYKSKYRTLKMEESKLKKKKNLMNQLITVYVGESIRIYRGIWKCSHALASLVLRGLNERTVVIK